MAKRLGEVLCWTFCVLAVLAWLAMWIIMHHGPQAQYGGVDPILFGLGAGQWIGVSIPSLALWAIGRACRYVLAGF